MNRPAPSLPGATPGGRGLATVPRALRLLAGALFIAAVPTVLITTSVRQIAADLAFYERGFARYEVARRTGLSTVQLREIAQAFIDYFDGKRADLQVIVDLPAGRRPLFNEREIEHMHDVRELMDWVRRLQLGVGGVLLVVPLVGFLLARGDFSRSFGRLCLLGGGSTLALLLLLGGLSLLDFSEAFVQFHLLMFRNDLWILDPRRDYLIMLFPEGFWFDATVRIAVMSAIQALAVAGAGAVVGFWAARR